MSKYRIERLIGIGGAAVVYEARPLLSGGDGAPVACKLMREEPRAVPEARALVQQEAALGLRVTPGHPNLVRVLDSFEDVDEGPCIVMELVEGGSLKALIRWNGRLSFPCTRRIAREVLQALAYLHAQDVLHRDLSPCNILISTSGSVKIADLGIAKVMERGHAHTRNYRGKLAYDSPEAIQTLTLDARSDLYTLAAVLYELLAGTPPCGDTEAFAEIVTHTLRGDFAPLPADTPVDLAELVTGLLRPEPDDRAPQTATDALALLDRHDQPVASEAELAALVMAMKSRRGGEPDDAHRASSLAPGEMLEPGDVLSARTAGEPGEAMPGAEQPPAAAQVPVFPLPAEPPLPPLPQPRARITTTLARAGEPARSQSPEPAHVDSLSRSRRDAVYRAVGGTLLAFCVLVSGFLIHDRLWRLWRPRQLQSDAGDMQHRPDVPVPVVPTPAPPVPVTPERPVIAETDQPAKRRYDRKQQRTDGPRPARTGSQGTPAPGESAELRWEFAPRLASEPPRWRTP